MPQIAHADHDEVMVVVHAQNVPDFRTQFLYIVAIALLAEFTKATVSPAGFGRQ